jgi:hypothetical protein
MLKSMDVSEVSTVSIIALMNINFNMTTRRYNPEDSELQFESRLSAHTVTK